MEHASFNPACTTPCRTVTTTPSRLSQTPTRPVCCCLSFDLDSDQEYDATPMHVNSADSDQDADSPSASSSDSSSDEEEDFQTVPTEDEHWTTEMVPERTFCIHENGLPNNVCQYPCPYGNNNNSVLYMDSLD